MNALGDDAEMRTEQRFNLALMSGSLSWRGGVCERPRLMCYRHAYAVGSEKRTINR